MEGPKTAQKRTSSTITIPISPKGSLRSRRKTVTRNPGASGITSMAAMGSETCADTGIEPGDEEIGDGHGDGEERHGRQHGALHHRVIMHIGGIDDQLADAGAGEDVLG